MELSRPAVVTCAHVLAAELGLAKDDPPGTTERVEEDLPLLCDAGKLFATVESAVPRLPSGGGDVAMLRLDALPPGAALLRLLETEQRDVWDDPAWAFGFHPPSPQLNNCPSCLKEIRLEWLLSPRTWLRRCSFG